MDTTKKLPGIFETEEFLRAAEEARRMRPEWEPPTPEQQQAIKEMFARHASVVQQLQAALMGSDKRS